MSFTLLFVLKRAPWHPDADDCQSNETDEKQLPDIKVVRNAPDLESVFDRKTCGDEHAYPSEPDECMVQSPSDHVTGDPLGKPSPSGNSTCINATVSRTSSLSKCAKPVVGSKLTIALGQSLG